MIAVQRSLTVVAAVLAVLLVLLVSVGRSSKASVLPWISTAPGPVETLKIMYGSRLETATVHAQEDVGTLLVKLGSGEPTGTEPFRTLASLVGTVPAKREYQITFHVPGTVGENLVGYIWHPDSRRLQLLRGYYSGSVGTMGFVGYMSNVDTEALAAIGSGRRLLPAFHD